MALTKQAVSINFSQGINTKTDPWQLPVGQFQDLKNSVFTKQGLLTKRNGFGLLANTSSKAITLTTYSSTLIGLGDNLQAYSPTEMEFLNSFYFQSLKLQALPLVRSTVSQTATDIAVAANGLCIVTWIDSTTAGFYQVSDSVTGQTIVPAVALASGAIAPRVYVLGQYFIVLYNIGTDIQYIAIPIANPQVPLAPVNLATNATSNCAFDGIVALNNLYVAYGSASGLSATFLPSTLSLLSQVTVIVAASITPTRVSITSDSAVPTPHIWISWYEASTHNITTRPYSSALVPNSLGPQVLATGRTINELTSTTNDAAGIWVFWENINTYSYTPNARTDYIERTSIDITGSSSANVVILRSVGIASKPVFLTGHGNVYMLVAYGGILQPTYFLIDINGAIVAKVAYTNGGGYLSSQVVPGVSVIGDKLFIAYLYKDLLAAVNKDTNVPAGTQINGVYSQTGINLASFTIGGQPVSNADIASDLHMSGGLLWMYDGNNSVEHGFNVWPEDITVTTSASSGAITADTYFYQVLYQWTDNQGNIHRSAPSVPVSIVTTGSTSTNTINIPYLRLTYKTNPPAQIVIYRWSTSQPEYFRITSIINPAVNQVNSDSLTYIDNAADFQIEGNDLIYTTGGVIENIGAPGLDVMSLFQSRLFLVDAEDRNLLWFSKQVIEGTPVEMSDLFTLYVAPSIGAQGSTGPITALAAMDDKLIIFKKDAMYYITGSGPDNTGTNDQFSDPIFISSTVGCNNPSSIVLMPSGIMFQSDKGIWLLGRDLSTNYIGAPVEAYNDAIVTSAVAVPGTNQVRFTLNNHLALMYDYFFSQWSVFNNISAVSSTLYQGLHTYLNAQGQLLQETEGIYLDNSSPVLMSFITSWLNIAGLQGYERFYFANLLGTYLTPFNLNVQLAYDYGVGQSQSILVTPDNVPSKWGSQSLWGGGNPWGQTANVFSARLFPEKQKCQSFQVTVNEVYDATQGTAAGAGLTLSGLALVVGVKKGYRTQSAAKSFG